MKNAYAFLGLAFLIVFLGAYLVINKAHAPNELKTNGTDGEVIDQ